MNWRYKIELNQRLREMGEQFDLSYLEEDCPQEVKQAISAECRKAPSLRRFAEIVLGCKSIAAVNRVLAAIYDEADRSAIWCGM